MSPGKYMFQMNYQNPDMAYHLVMKCYNQDHKIPAELEKRLREVGVITETGEIKDMPLYSYIRSEMKIQGKKAVLRQKKGVLYL